MHGRYHDPFAFHVSDVQSLDAQFGLKSGIDEAAALIRDEQLCVVHHFARRKHEILFYMKILNVLDQQIEFLWFVFRQRRRIHEDNG